MIEQKETEQTMRLLEHISHLDQSKQSLVLVEGFKPESIPKIELYHSNLGQTLICNSGESAITLTTDAAITEKLNLIILDLDNHTAIVKFITLLLITNGIHHV